jgi:undecaprenyl-diphosphatase
MSPIESVLLGLLQGVTEFLPVSSSGHLALLEHVWRLDAVARLPLTAMLHVGTAVAMLVYFGRRLGRIVAGCVSRDAARRGENWRMVGFVALGSVPAVGIGLLLEEHIEAAFASPVLVAVMLLATGGLLFGTRFAQGEGQSLGWGRVLLVGVAQAVAILPGISRSGATIATGIYLGLKREAAFEFSFLLGIPVILGAGVREAAKVQASALSPAVVGVGVLVALVSGLAALALLRRAVTGRKLYLFAFYCWTAGLAALVFLH